MRWLQRQRLVFALLIFVGLIGGWGFWVYWNGPYRAFRVIVSAMERKDIDLLYEFVLDEEKKMGVTKEKVAQALGDILYHRADVVKAIPVKRMGYGKVMDEMYRFHVAWADGITGKPFPSFRKVIGLMTLRLELYKAPKRRWKFSFTIMARSYFLINLPFVTSDGKPLPRRKYVQQAFARWGIPGVFKPPPYLIIKGRKKFVWERWGIEPP
jgi:hypothetical protein